MKRPQTRYSLIIGGFVAALFTLISAYTIFNAYNTAFALFESIAVFYAPKVNASENALQYLARTSQAMADYTALSSDTPLYEQAVNNIFRNFNSYRDELFILRTNLESDEERAAFLVADTFTYSRFWRHVGNLIEGRSDIDLARREYLAADNNLRNRIVPALEDLEAINVELMLDASTNAGTNITIQMVFVAMAGFSLAIVSTGLSFWLRGKIRRYVTPALDLAMIAAWAVPILILLEFAALPAQLDEMTGEAYNSISGSSRVLVAGDLANRSESSAIIDVERADYWFGQFDSNIENLELRLCGAVGCTETSFIGLGSSNLSNTTLIANVAFEGEIEALEEARLALLEYIGIHQSLKAQIEAGDMDSALALNTSGEAGSSEEAYSRFVAKMQDVQEINRQVFDAIWAEQRASLPRNQLIYGIIASVLIVVLTAIGVNNRYREL
jgi:hypothetical protein